MRIQGGSQRAGRLEREQPDVYGALVDQPLFIPRLILTAAHGRKTESIAVQRQNLSIGNLSF